MTKIVLLSGSPNIASSSHKVLEVIEQLLQNKGFTTDIISVTQLPQQDLMTGNFGSKALQPFIQRIEQADGVIVASPVYKASYTGVLKSFFDLLPQQIFQRKTVLPIMTGGSIAHLLAIDYAFKPLITTLKGQALQGVYVVDEQMDKNAPHIIIDEAVWQRLRQQLEALDEAIALQKVY